VGHNRVRHAGGAVVELGPCDRVEMNAGDTFIIETPGGGGYGKPESAADERR
jgi:5-oxoprolinase (ATP-hydrolysing)